MKKKLSFLIAICLLLTNMTGFVFAIPGIGPILFGIEGGSLLSRFLTERKMTEIENSDSKCLRVNTVSSYGGTSSTWLEWSDTPYVYIPTSAINVNVTRF